MADEVGSIGDTRIKDKSEESTEESCNGDSKTDSEGDTDVCKLYNLDVPPRPQSFILKSSKLGSSLGDVSSTPTKSFLLNPSRLTNHTPSQDERNKEVKDGDSLFSTPSSTQVNVVVAASSNSNLSFIPLGSESAPTPSKSTSTFATTSTPSLGFVFGQNIHEKVEAAAPVETSTDTSAEPSTSSEQPVTTNGTSAEMLFSTIVSKDNAEKSVDNAKSLSEAAREYEESRAQKRRYEEVPVLTGEEEEANVLQINCKLFSWSSCSWTERGRGTLRVNDLPTTSGIHRLIVRTAGSLRVVLNTKIWAGMTVDRASVKSMRITAMDSNGVVKVFLVMASPKEMDQLQKCLEWRVSNLKRIEDPAPKKLKTDDS